MWTSLVLFPIGVMALAFVLGWLFQRTGSIWMCGIAHMTNNVWGSAPPVQTPSWTARNATDLVAAVVVVAVVAVARSGRRRQHEPVVLA